LKISIYPEDIVVSLASIKLGKPIKWVETRMENLLATSHGRGQKQFIEAAVDSDGRIHGLKLKLVTDAGAYSIEGSVLLPEETIQMAPGAYDIAAFRGELFAVFTNKVPQDAYRGAGRPEAAYLIERTVNAIAASLRLDPVKVRLKNFIPRNKFPFKTAGDYVYDTGDYERNLLKALEFANYDALRADQRVARSEGRLVGIGMATYTEICGFGPNWAQTAAVTVTRTGQVIIHSGGSPHGQGHVTPFAQIVAGVLGVDVTSIAVHFGDTMSLPWGTITAGSRSAVVGGTAVLIAARRVKEKMSKIAAKKLGLKSDRMTFSNGKIYSQESTGKEIGFVELAKLAYRPKELPPGMEPTLFEYCAWAPPGNVFPFGTHIAVVEVDRQTGFVNILKYFAVDDVGRVLNPLIVEGQVQGGALQGIGQALLEKVIYDENGQLLTATLMDYLVPSSDSAPNIAWTRTETPSPLNPLGVKGVGEAGTIAATPAIVNAVEDALSPFDVRIREMPLSPEYVNSLLREAGRGLDNPSSVVAVH
jgi:carbon-monoxide dehydrogenase large subunit